MCIMQLSEQLARAFAVMGRTIHDRGAELPRPDFLVLARLAASTRDGDVCRLSDLAQAEGLDPSTMSRRIASLTDRGLVERAPDPDDRRAHQLRLTPEGVRALEAERARRVGVITDALADWDEADKEQLAGLLAQLTDSLEARRTRA